MATETTTAHLTVDMVLLTVYNDALHVLLIKRGWPPFEGAWALPGGYVDEGETFDAAARRELQEETNLVAPPHLERVDVYGDPGRDPRGRVVSVAYVAVLPTMPSPTAGDDAREAQWTPVADALATAEGLAFDHHRILTDAVARVDGREAA
jgi:8-oxo-dGTP diphosphatase